jgi:hypothetical protein
MIILLLLLYSHLFGLGSVFSFLILYRVGRTPWTGDQPDARPLPTHRTIQTRNKRTQTSMPSVGFEHTIPAFKREETVHALDRAAALIGKWMITNDKFWGERGDSSGQFRFSLRNV